MDFYAKSLPGRIKTAHAHKERCQALVDDGNEYAVGSLKSAGRELEALLAEAAERDIPAEEIAEATSYRPVSKLREEIVELQRLVASYQRMLEERDNDRQSLREEVAAYQRVQVGMEREREQIYSTLDRAKARLGAPLLALVFLSLYMGGMEVLQWAGLAVSSPLAWGGMVAAVIVTTLAIMIGLDRSIDG